MIRTFLIALPLAAALAGCQQPNQGALTGAALGAATGVAVSGDDDRATGALVGGAIGAAAGNYVGRDRNQPGSCLYERPDGSRFYATCR
ncbi:glycine zipper domain-containing protein [uncultured Jannaschia sp.]|uniref:glycine zipper 2TM domain-containing protein n=1 Tax=uncultured Jannaschia sp. TaxID=293347 RepID=UPI00263917FE|nr:glycine zipper domain-containing protein [uncultured Jannaschia sp.]